MPACSKTDPAGVAPTPAADRPELDAIVAADVAIERILKEADDLSARGADVEAIEALDKRALPAIDAALAKARAAAVASAWGIARRDEWVGILSERRTETARYAAAIREGELEGRVAAMQAQATLTRRAMAAAKAVQVGP